MQVILFLFLLCTGCVKKTQLTSLKDLLPQQISSVPIGISLVDFQSQHSEDYEIISLSNSIKYLKKPIASPELNFIQYQFQNDVLKEVLIGYKSSFAASDIAESLYGKPNEDGRWLATNSEQKSVTIEIIDNTIIYR